jgi:hypothetical protein
MSPNPKTATAEIVPLEPFRWYAHHNVSGPHDCAVTADVAWFTTVQRCLLFGYTAARTTPTLSL